MEGILRALERDGRLTPAQLAAESGRSEEEVRTLIAEAEARHILLGYGAKVNWEAAGQPIVYALVEILAQPEEDVGYKSIAARIARFDEVQTCYFMSGEYDLAVIVTGASMHEISDFVGEKLATMHGVQRTVTHVIMRRYKEHGIMLQSAEESDRQAVVL
ncbi:MAG: Lrp/AsnC family transcriptional regulator [Dehalococcoidia bacterium]